MPRRVLATPAPSRHARRARRRDTLRIARRRLSAFATTGTAAAHRGVTELAGLARRVAAHDLRTRLGAHWRTASRAVALPYSHDERQILLLLFLPFLLVATAIVAHQSMRTLYAFVTLAATERPEFEVASLRPDVAKTALPPAAELPRSSARGAVARETATPATPLAYVADVPPATGPRPSLPRIHALVPPPDIESRQGRAGAELGAPAERPAPLLATAPPPVTPPVGSHATLALLGPAVGLGRSPPSVAPAAIDAFEADEMGRPIFPGLCTVADAARETAITTAALPVSTAGPVSLGPEAFGLRLAHAAEAQAAGFVIYNDAYRSIAYPMGDVHHMFGVCTDVVIRAYRALGIDLQALVHQTRSGRGDRNIDHRRTEVLRRFFATHGESLPVSPFAEDYRPGDIVTYHRPQNRGSRSHIAVVSSEIAPSGRPMIVHNRGWGPQLEDALFVDRITGHYRYRGPETARDAASLSPPRQTTRAARALTRPASSDVAAAAVPVLLPAPAN